jgi:hypothetical protein
MRDASFLAGIILVAGCGENAQPLRSESAARAASPGKSKESNWLPAPANANFSLHVRAD